MEQWLVFFVNSIGLGIGLAMDAFSVSLANGLKNPTMCRCRMCLIAGIFAFFQFLMPIIGWFCVKTVIQHFQRFEIFIPWIALALLLFIGCHMIFESLKTKTSPEQNALQCSLGFSTLLLQGIATSIDALSVGFTMANYNLVLALASSVIIAIVTFFICIGGLVLGKKFGTNLAGKGSLLGGIILILIGIEIFVTGLFF